MRLHRNDLIIVVAALLVPVIAYFTLFQSRLRTLRQLRQDEIELTRKTEEAEPYSRLAALRTNVRNLTKELDSFFTPIPASDRALASVDTILRHAQDSGLKVDLFQPGKTTDDNGLGCLSVQFGAHGDFAQIYNFLSRIESDKSVMTVERLELESMPPAEQCTMKLELRIHFVKPPQEKPA